MEHLISFELLSGIAGGVHVFFFILESILLPRSVAVQKIFGVRREHMNGSIALFSVNQGYYNLMLALATFYGLYHDELELVKGILFIYVGAATVLFISTSGKLYRGAIVQGIPALAALLMGGTK
eukprot:scaffold6417_cov87-Cyclotella_meneghiniana.AAC.12